MGLLCGACERGERVLGCVWRGKRERTVPLDTEIDRRTVAPRRDARDGGRVERIVRTRRLIDGDPVHGRRRPRPRHLVTRQYIVQVGYEAGGVATGEPFVIGRPVGVHRKAGHVEGVARVVEANSRRVALGRRRVVAALGCVARVVWDGIPAHRGTRAVLRVKCAAIGPRLQMEFKNGAVLLVAREYSWVLACVKVEFRVSRCKEQKCHGTSTTGKRGAKGPNSLVNRRALPVASPMGWERSRSGGDGGGGGGGACGKQSSQSGKAPWPQHQPRLTYWAQPYSWLSKGRPLDQLGVSPPRHSIDVPSGTIPSGELLPQYRAPFTSDDLLASTENDVTEIGTAGGLVIVQGSLYAVLRTHCPTGSAPQLTATCATAASPAQPLPRVYSKANDRE
eukprot:scaffold82170_cov72-Phaeocystis_antarctica.AAC.3